MDSHHRITTRGPGTVVDKKCDWGGSKSICNKYSQKGTTVDFAEAYALSPENIPGERGRGKGTDGGTEKKGEQLLLLSGQS